MDTLASKLYRVGLGEEEEEEEGERELSVPLTVKQRQRVSVIHQLWVLSHALKE